MPRVNSTKIVSRFFDSSAHALPITFYNRKTPANMPTDSQGNFSSSPETPKYPGMETFNRTRTIRWDSITDDKYKFDSTLTRTRAKAVWSADISNWHYPKIFHPGFEYAIWGRNASDRSWLLYDKVADIPDSDGKVSYTFPGTIPTHQFIVMIHNPNYPPTTDILNPNANPKPDCWHFLVGAYSAV